MCPTVSFGLTRLPYWVDLHEEGSEVNYHEASGLLFRVRQIAVAGRWASLGMFFESGFPLSSRGFLGFGFPDWTGARGRRGTRARLSGLEGRFWTG